MRSCAPILFAIAAAAATVAHAQTTQPIQWHSWSNDVFAQARREHKFVLLDLEAVWCHWCHVMDETTYRDPNVRRLMAEKYIAVKVDQDSRPDLANRYEDYGWPATVVFGPDGKEIVKRRGYLEPAEMASMLQAIIADPTPGPSVQPTVELHPPVAGGLSGEQRKELDSRIRKLYDPKAGGWGRGYKFIDADVIEYCLLQARHGDAQAEQMARQTLTAGLGLIDPAWGGVYQYSTDADWVHPHFEKIMSYQADDLRTFSRAFLQLHDASYLHAADAIHRFLENFLTSPSGAFYTSMDADRVPGEHGAEYFSLDDAGRRELGLPRIDTHIYSRENGWAIEALAEFYAVTGDPEALAEAEVAAKWIMANRSLDGGGFRHDQSDAAGPFLGDTLAMGRAFLSLYEVTAQRQWLSAADSAGDFIEKDFSPSGNSAGLATSHGGEGDGMAATPQIDENIAAARFERLLFAYTGKKAHQKAAETAMRYLAAPETPASRNWLVGGILLADREMSSVPLHITVVGSKHDPDAQDLFEAAIQTPISYLRLEWFDPRDGPLMNSDVDYPPLPAAAAFLCTGNACSSPMRDPAALRQRIEQVLSLPR